MKKMKKFTLMTLAAASVLAGCSKSPSDPKASDSPSAPAVETEQKNPPKVSATEQPSAKKAKVGQPAPEFELPNLKGSQVKLSDYRGKVVVLEWFNPGCPFVKAAHTKGSLVQTAKELTDKGVVYLAINSGAPGKQGAGVEANLAGKQAFGIEHDVLLDESGETGRSYGATNTPQLFVINQEGVLEYAGAVDNSPDGEAGSPEGGTLIKYMEEAVEEVLAGKPVSRPETKPYGCSVKYGS